MIKSLRKYKNHINIYSVILFWVKKSDLKKGYYGNEGLGLAWDCVKVFQRWIFWVIFDGFLKDEKKDFKQNVLRKNVWVVSLDTLFKGSSFFLVKKVLWDEGFGFCYKAIPKSSITHYSSQILKSNCVSLNFI